MNRRGSRSNLTRNNSSTNSLHPCRSNRSSFQINKMDRNILLNKRNSSYLLNKKNSNINSFQP